MACLNALVDLDFRARSARPSHASLTQCVTAEASVSLTTITPIVVIAIASMAIADAIATTTRAGVKI